MSVSIMNTFFFKQNHLGGLSYESIQGWKSNAVKGENRQEKDVLHSSL